MAVRPGRWRDPALVAVISGFTALVSQRWTGFNSPDSEFYASLALFGDEVTDRAVEPAYPWTRLGYILPVRALVTAFGPWIGFEVWRVVLITLIVGATYGVVRIAGRSRLLAVVLSVAVSLNTVVLAFVGNTYLTGTILAALFVVIAVAVWLLGRDVGRERWRWAPGAMAGGLFGWLVMLNPYALILGAGLWSSVRLVALVRIAGDRWHRLLRDALGVVAGFVVVLALFLAAGQRVFPGRSWWGTYTEWNSRLDYTVFVGDPDTWQQDSALLVVVISVIASVVAAATRPRRRWAWAALALSVANVVVTVVVMVVIPGPWLETPTYLAKLWPAALVALVLALAAMWPGTLEPVGQFTWVLLVGLVVLVPLLLWAGRFDEVLAYSVAWLLAGAVGALIVVTAIVSRTAWNSWTAGLVVLSVVGTFVGAQVLQNGRGNLGSYGQYPFRSAFVDFNYRDQMASKITLQEWLLSRTDKSDRIALWTDPDRLTADAAGMQLWGGYNIFTTDAVLDRSGALRLQEMRPSVVAMYAPDSLQIEALFASLPPWSLPSELECTAEPYLGVGSGEAHLCITRLTWVD